MAPKALRLLIQIRYSQPRRPGACRERGRPSELSIPPPNTFSGFPDNCTHALTPPPTPLLAHAQNYCCFLSFHCFFGGNQPNSFPWVQVLLNSSSEIERQWGPWARRSIDYIYHSVGISCNVGGKQINVQFKRKETRLIASA